MALPARWAVPRMALAVPASCLGTRASTKSWFGAITIPLPSPASSSGAASDQPSGLGAHRCQRREPRNSNDPVNGC